ncbi:5-methyltetrahydropteroyltriglutamate--homocysteine S-methyltransferase [Pseudodesulfovibrio senegalensis]|uniref:5-methyltetrahydropteroyltriglutamate--homocysteine methyltransferase n=1 Tax=Pseudodesulfovibrio senegalensis TaxID=1721087 RepID=A0A6N6N5F6_9BACT|nr:5-methyltetrahydropteroyltriglutamate--homocysteine S-methyltransferase [Pseudodesulfovibrio senegalensis]KAB1442705.1 5-methyltetrahydropteroyltriglutamate--homocysteine S-methyltransferase [Pseudodesulfovibrio senegalensis]
MLTHSLGFPRMGIDRELKKVTEAYWKGEKGEQDLLEQGAQLRVRHWEIQAGQGVDLLPVGDFSHYDHMLDTVALLGAVPARYGWEGGSVDTDTYFRMARGDAGHGGATAMEMTKWFDTNYHYIVPEFTEGQTFSLSSTKIFDELDEAVAAGYAAKPVLPGPFTFIGLGKSVPPGFDRWEHLDAIVAVYEEVLGRLSAKCAWVQLDEPLLALDLDAAVTDRFAAVYERLATAAGSAKILVATYFGGVDHHAETLLSLPVGGVHVDLVRAPEQLDAFAARLPEAMHLSLGLVDGRNVWKVDMDKALELVDRAVLAVGADRVMLAPSCSLLHTPVDLSAETGLDAQVREWMAFAVQKCAELDVLRRAAVGQDAQEELAANRAAWDARRSSPLTANAAVRERMESVNETMARRVRPYAERIVSQRERLKLPLLPTTTIGSFPQTPEIRRTRLAFKKGELAKAGYTQAMQGFIAESIEKQEQLGLDVLVHGEAERNDMVEYFGEQLDGFCFTANGWVQSYGSRCVKPPVIFGDVFRPGPMTVEWIRYAQSLTDKPVKGMLTGPVTILQWSFVRDDQPRSETCRQIALAVRDEVVDLEADGVAVIQIDEPALREGLPLRRDLWKEYLDWGVECFRLSASGVQDHTQIHTHMCYAEFNDIIEWIAAMDADVISIEASRSNMELLEAFGRFDYPAEVGPGVYDIHSPRVPPVQEMVDLLRRASKVLPVDHLWVNPDCGLKTRGWPETMEALANMVEAAAKAREILK